MIMKMEPQFLQNCSEFCTKKRNDKNSTTSNFYSSRIMRDWKWSVPKLVVIFILFLSYGVEWSEAGKILIVHPMYTGSHVLTLRTVADSLTKRGHQIHIVRWRDEHYFPTVNNPNITETLLSVDNSEGKWTFLTKEKQAAFKVPYDILWNSGLSYKSVVDTAGEAFPLIKKHCDDLLSNKELINQLSEEKYDVAIIDILYNECGLALLHHPKVPSVGYWAFPFSSGEADWTTAFLPSSHIPAFMSRLTHEMTFVERIYNFLMKLGSHFVVWLQCWNINQSLQKYLPGSPHPYDLLKDINGMLINTDYALDYPRLLPPTFINVGGMQIREPRPLPKEIEDWMQSSGEHGVVLLTMGFIFKPQVVPKRLVNAFMEAFSRFPQKFLVKFEGPIDHVPPNVKVLQWIPQQDVLAHPKTKVFVTHCGLHGVMEAIYFAVPMVGMPIFIDQGDALIKMKEKGIAVGFDKDTATADEIYELISEVLTNSTYKSNIEKLSHLMRDVSEPPLDRVLNFIEYIMRHKGAEHLKLSSRHLSFIQYFSLDVIAFFSAIILGVLVSSLVVLYFSYKFGWPVVKPQVLEILEKLQQRLNESKHRDKVELIQARIHQLIHRLRGFHASARESVRRHSALIKDLKDCMLNKKFDGDSDDSPVITTPIGRVADLVSRFSNAATAVTEDIDKKRL